MKIASHKINHISHNVHTTFTHVHDAQVIGTRHSTRFTKHDAAAPYRNSKHSYPNGHKKETILKPDTSGRQVGLKYSKIENGMNAQPCA